MRKLWILIAALAVVALFATCSLLTKTTIDDCINNFMGDINGDHGSVYKNLDSSSTLYAEALTAAYWDIPFPSSDSYSLSGRSTSGSTVTATLSSGTLYSGGVSIVFTMSTDATGNAVIHSITVAGIPIFN